MAALAECFYLFQDVWIQQSSPKHKFFRLFLKLPLLIIT